MKLACCVMLPDSSINLFAYRDSNNNIEKALTDLKGIGFDGVELFVRDTDQLEISSIEKMIEKLDLEVCSVGTSPIGVQDKLLLTDPRREVRDEAINRAKKAIDFAALFGADVNVGKFRGNIPADNRITGWNWLREGFETMCEYAQRKNIMVSVEPQERGNLNTLNTTQEAVQWIETVNIQNLGLLLDTYHMSFERQSLSTSFVDGAKHLRHVHIADTGRLGPGQGSIDFMEVVKILKGIGYKGYLSLETAQKPEGYAITAQSWKYMDYLCNQLL